MTELVANFTLTDNPIEANFSLEETNIDALFEIKAAGTTWGSIVGNLADQTDLQAALNAKQDIIADLEAIRTGAQNGDFSYSTILTYGDIVTYNAAAFATAAQGALAETALQSITSSDVTTALGYTPYNATNPNGYITATALTDYALLSDIPTDNAQLANGAGYITSAALAGYVLSSDLATVATSGSYNDLSNKPTIPAAQVNSDWNAVSGAAQILNKPTIPTVNNATLTIQKNGNDVQTFTANASSNVTCNITVPTNTNELTNGAGFITGVNSTDVTTALGYSPADVDLTNVTNSAKVMMSGMGMPSGTVYDNLTLGASGATYSAPSNGWFCLALKASETGQEGKLIRNPDRFGTCGTVHVAWQWVRLYLPVNKGDVVVVEYSTPTRDGMFRFYYANGSESEAN